MVCVRCSLCVEPKFPIRFFFLTKIFQINSLSNIQIELILDLLSYMFYCFPGCSDDKEYACNAGDLGSIPGLGRSPGEGNGNPLQYSGLGNPMDREVWRATVHGVTKSWAWYTYIMYKLIYICFIIVLDTTE